MKRSTISVSQIIRWTSFVAVYLALAGHLINSSRSIGVSAMVVSCFVLLDVYRRYSNDTLLAISYFCCGLSWSMVSMVLTLVYWPEPIPPRPPMPFLVAAAYVISGQWYADFTAGLIRVAYGIMLYFACFTIATVTSSLLTIPRFRKHNGWKILLANSPGLLFIICVVIGMILSSMRNEV